MSIWGIDKNGYLCIFELKAPGNKHLGIISELFCYSAYAHDVLLNKLNKLNNNRLLHEPAKVNYRGYEKLYNAVKSGKIKGVNAFFLLPKDDGHPSIVKNMNKLREEMNNNSLKIDYDFLVYEPEIIDMICINKTCEELVGK